MMKKAFALVALGAILYSPVATPSTSAQITPKNGGYLLRMKFVKGSVQKYTMTSTMPMMKSPMTASMTNTVKAVSNGIATVQTEVKSSQGNNKTEVQIDSMGKMVKGNSMGVNPTTLPKDPVKVGQSWKGSMPLPQGGGRIDAVYKLAGVKTVGGRQVAEVTMTLDGAMGPSKMKGAGRMTLAMGDCSLVNSVMNINFTMPSQKKGEKATQLAMTVNIKRV
jgi:hypothetical protein